MNSVDWLLDSSHPAVRYLALTDLLDLPEDHLQVILAHEKVLDDPWIEALFTGQQPDGKLSEVTALIYILTRSGWGFTGGWSHWLN